MQLKTRQAAGRGGGVSEREELYPRVQGLDWDDARGLAKVAIADCYFQLLAAVRVARLNIGHEQGRSIKTHLSSATAFWS